MSKIDYETIEKKSANANNQRVSYFALKNDGDEAIVRIMHQTPQDFDIVAVHNATVNGKIRKINCLRNAYDPIECCPFCASEKPLYQRIYIHLIRYIKDENGNITPSIQIWDRPTAFINTLKNLCLEYGDLSKSIFKIKRNGKACSTDTTYDIMYTNPNVYRDDIYKPVSNAFENIEAVGTVVLDKNFEYMKNLIESELSPASNTATPTPNYSEPINTNLSTTVQQNSEKVKINSNPTPYFTEDNYMRPTRIYNPNIN